MVRQPELVIHVAGANGLAIGSDCPVGSYRITIVVAKLSTSTTDLATAILENSQLSLGLPWKCDLVVHLNYARGANRCHLEIYSSEQYSR